MSTADGRSNDEDSQTSNELADLKQRQTLYIKIRANRDEYKRVKKELAEIKLSSDDKNLIEIAQKKLDMLEEEFDSLLDTTIDVSTALEETYASKRQKQQEERLRERDQGRLARLQAIVKENCPQFKVHDIIS
eukprot:Phypoly_transcript_14732.p1 GENE.Phypoly_transcript_14732~~Phypoly_transcript_14732.p1  ORF type:complete len:133 (-),score=28.72 Phypoly_transcript_14732:42-440(-)